MRAHSPAPEPQRGDAGADTLLAPEPRRWRELLGAGDASGSAILFGMPWRDWRRRMRDELQLPVEGPMVATGHQALLWHPGILAKYIALDAFAAAVGAARVNLVVDQHADGFGGFDVPARAGGGLVVRTVRMTADRAGVPMALHPAFEPLPPPAGLAPALPSVASGVERVLEALRSHKSEPDAARQITAALADLMRPWVAPVPSVTASRLLASALGRRLVQAMVEDARGCASAYNRAIEALQGRAIPGLVLEDEELPLWGTGPDGTRRRATAADAGRWLEEGAPRLRLFPRALLLTALVRLGLCDLFIHGTGGAAYDRAMEAWVRGWLGCPVAPAVVASATLRLPLDGRGGAGGDGAAAVARLHWAWHDPEAVAGAQRPGACKRRLLRAIDAAPRRSAGRRQAFAHLHEELERLRREREAELEALRDQARQALRAEADAPIAERRDWAFPLHDPSAIDAMAGAIRSRFGSV